MVRIHHLGKRNPLTKYISMRHLEILLLSLFLFSGYAGKAQIPFDSTLVSAQFHKLGPLYLDVIRNAHFVKAVYEEGYDGTVASPRPHMKGEATFIFEVADNGSLLNIYITEFWWYTDFSEKIDVKDYIVFVDEDNLGFDQAKIKQHKLRKTSVELIDHLFDQVRENIKFRVVEPRERNLKYLRVRLE